jgi:hypothetical protein
VCLYINLLKICSTITTFSIQFNRYKYFVRYAHIQQSSRVELGKKFESGFYAKPDTSSPQAVPAAGEPTISMTALLELLKDADPEMKAKLRLALLT